MHYMQLYKYIFKMVYGSFVINMTSFQGVYLNKHQYTVSGKEIMLNLFSKFVINGFISHCWDSTLK